MSGYEQTIIIRCYRSEFIYNQILSWKCDMVSRC